MMQENSLSADQVAAVLEDASVSAVDVWALLYANQQARDGATQTGLKGHRDGAASTLRWTTDEPHAVRRCCVFRTATAPSNCVEKLTDWNGRVTQKPYLISRAFAKCERGVPHPAKGLETTFQSISCGLYVYQIMDGKISILVFQ
jgi:hypothetical protein